MVQRSERPAAAKVAIGITRMARETSPIQKELEAAFRNTASTSALGIESILAVTVSAL